MKVLIPLTSIVLFAASLIGLLTGCERQPSSSDATQREQQERILMEGTSSVGMPAIKNFRMKRLLKDIIELCDQDGVVTYTYIVAEATGKLIYLGESIGYGIPSSMQFTNPQKVEKTPLYGGGYSYDVISQADPSGLFSPTSADGTWVMMKDPSADRVVPVFVEPRCIVSPFKLPTQ